ncbi:MAG: hypothetical protein R3B92_01870 [Patescibacteria group bacterium]|uniref:Uncharacterized protein n=1 Tax=candidate division WWE3 bacterium TaxID=2053526 RepID=A0A955J2Q2_UNCKA|nr:hypothetical protein [candidate division WWE3 bacterium]
MTKNPIINGLSASGYIVVVVTLMQLATRHLRDQPDTFFAPIVALSLLTLSVTVMALIFFLQPVQMYTNGKKKEAIELFTKTVGVFAASTLVTLLLLALRLV